MGFNAGLEFCSGLLPTVKDTLLKGAFLLNDTIPINRELTDCSTRVPNLYGLMAVLSGYPMFRDSKTIPLSSWGYMSAWPGPSPKPVSGLANDFSNGPS